MNARTEDLALGARLRQGRERAGLTVIQAAERLHVDPYVIEALEAERFDELGAPVYVRGHIRHYAELVGEPAAELQGLYATSAHAGAKPDLTRVPKGKESTEASNALLLPAVVFVVAVAAIGTAWWIAGTLKAASRPHRDAPPPATASLAPQGPPAGGSPAGALPAGTSAAGASAAGASAARAGRGLPVPPGGSGAGSGSGPGSGVSAAHAPPAGAAAIPAAVAQPAGRMPASRTPAAARPEAPHARVSSLRLHFAEDSWAEVYDARGERLFYDVGAADSTQTVSGAPPLKIVLGNPAGVSMQLDGRPVSIPDGAERNVSVEFRLTRSGRVAPAHLASAGARAP